jgi:glycosyltransferase involved in cell wall biosynthesis
VVRPATQLGRLRLAVVLVAVIATAVKVYLAKTTIGSNDVGFFSQFAEGIRQFGPVEIYGKKLSSLPYNHAPLSGWLLVAINWLTDNTPLSLRFLIKLPAILADLISAVLVFEIVRRSRSVIEAAAAGIALSLSPILLVISGFHGNTDPVFVMFGLLSLYLLVSGRSSVLAGAAFAASLSIKIVPIVLLPVLLLIAWRAGPRKFAGYLLGSGVVLAVLWGPVVLTNWVAYRTNVLEYGGIDRRQWGIVQFAHWLDIPAPWVAALVGPGRFLVVVVAALLPLLLAWRRPEASTRAAGLTLVIFLLLSTASATQYLAWAAAAVFLVSFWAGLAYNLVGGAFLIYAYDRWNGGVPPWRWNVANVTDWTGREVRFAAVVWLTLLAVAIVGALPTRTRPQVEATGAGPMPPPSNPARSGRLVGVTIASTTASPAPQEDDAVSLAPSSTAAQDPVATPDGDGATVEPAHAHRIGILVVAYNAATTLQKTLDRIPVDFRSRITEVIVLDDASHDDTFEHGQVWAQREDTPRTLVVRHTKNLGYGGNQKSAYALAMKRGLDIVVLLHGDGQYAPEMLPQMVAPLERGECEAVFGSRMMDKGAARRGGMPFYKRTGNRILTRIENGMLGTSLTEFHSGYRAYSVAALRELPLEHCTDDFDFDTQIIIQLVHAGKRIVEIPIPTYYGDEICYVNGMSYAKDVIKDVFEYKLAAKGFGTTPWVSKPDEYAFKDGDGTSHSMMLEMLAGAAPSRVLDVGCSGGLLAEHIRARGHHVVGVDYLEVPGVRDRTDEFYQADLNNDFPDAVGGGYDVVIAGDIIEHLMRPGNALKEMRRVLRPGGVVLLSVPNFGHFYPRFRATFGLFGYDRRGILDDTHLRFFTRRTLRRMVRSHGFDIIEERATGLPLGTISDADGFRLRSMRRIDSAFVRMRPTLFGYQFVLRLVPHAEEAVVVEGL